jgi:hypothetical protein
VSFRGGPEVFAGGVILACTALAFCAIQAIGSACTPKAIDCRVEFDRYAAEAGCVREAGKD